MPGTLGPLNSSSIGSLNLDLQVHKLSQPTQPKKTLPTREAMLNKKLERINYSWNDTKPRVTST